MQLRCLEMRCFLVRNHQQFPKCCQNICKSTAHGLPGLCNPQHCQGGAWGDQGEETPCRDIPGPETMFQGVLHPAVLSSLEIFRFLLVQSVTPEPWGHPDSREVFSTPRSFRPSPGAVVLPVAQADVLQREPPLCLWLIMTRKAPCSGFIMNESAPWKS